MLESKYEKLENVNETLIQSELTIANYHILVEEYKEELEDLLIKQRNLDENLKPKNKSISEEEARNEQIYKETLQSLKKAEGKLVKSKIRMKNLFGDCLMLAASVNYMGVFSLEEKTLLRQTIAQTLFKNKGIEVSEYWHSSDENNNAKMFKKLICDFGYSEIFQTLSHLFND